jgi:hypothetical protein
MKKPNRRASAKAIKGWMRQRWRESWWGTISDDAGGVLIMDCDRCHIRTASYPCETCPRWADLVNDFRKGALL